MPIAFELHDVVIELPTWEFAIIPLEFVSVVVELVTIPSVQLATVCKSVLDFSTVIGIRLMQTGFVFKAGLASVDSQLEFARSTSANAGALAEDCK